MTLLASLAVHLIVEHALESSLVHHLFVNGKGLEQGTLASTAALIAVVRLVKLSKSLQALRFLLVQETLSGRVRFLVRVARKVGISLGSDIVMLNFARRSIRI